MRRALMAVFAMLSACCNAAWAQSAQSAGTINGDFLLRLTGDGNALLMTVSDPVAPQDSPTYVTHAFHLQGMTSASAREDIFVRGGVLSFERGRLVLTQAVESKAWVIEMSNPQNPRYGTASVAMLKKAFGSVRQYSGVGVADYEYPRVRDSDLLATELMDTFERSLLASGCDPRTPDRPEGCWSCNAGGEGALSCSIGSGGQNCSVQCSGSGPAPWACCQYGGLIFAARCFCCWSDL